ncbi:MAG: site-2 protease family protein [Clostridiales bacterium]|nr:site-2 protease family protein [Clostridiales bacterium]
MLFSIFQNPIQIVYMLPALLLCLTAHEWGHAYVALRCGDPTARDLGRLTFNPLKHIDPIGFIMLMLAGFGWAKPVPVNPRNFRKPRRDNILVSLAGVTMNLILLIIAILLYGLLFGLWPQLGQYVGLFWVLVYFMVFNATLFIFNLLPIAPLDGSHILEAVFGRVIPQSFFAFLRRYGFLILLVLLITGALDPLFSFVNTGVLVLANRLAGFISLL